MCCLIEFALRFHVDFGKNMVEELQVMGNDLRDCMPPKYKLALINNCLQISGGGGLRRQTKLSSFYVCKIRQGFLYIAFVYPKYHCLSILLSF